MKKRIFCVIAAMSITVSFCGCGKSQNPSEIENNKIAASNQSGSATFENTSTSSSTASESASDSASFLTTDISIECNSIDPSKTYDSKYLIEPNLTPVTSEQSSAAAASLENTYSGLNSTESVKQDISNAMDMISKEQNVIVVSDDTTGIMVNGYGYMYTDNNNSYLSFIVNEDIEETITVKSNVSKNNPGASTSVTKNDFHGQEQTLINAAGFADINTANVDSIKNNSISGNIGDSEKDEDISVKFKDNGKIKSISVGDETTFFYTEEDPEYKNAKDNAVKNIETTINSNKLLQDSFYPYLSDINNMINR